jgi:hypothetical protein
MAVFFLACLATIERVSALPVKENPKHENAEHLKATPDG